MALEKFTVLICDDSLLIRKKLKEALEELNFQAIYEAQNGISAVEQVEKYKPNLVFLDIVMPEKDGIETLKEIKEISPETKVIMVSSVGTSSKLKEALQLGAYDFIQKPIQFETLTNIVEKALKEG
jgi:two-component system chemotaxis response regulator CheY